MKMRIFSILAALLLLLVPANARLIPGGIALVTNPGICLMVETVSTN